VASLGWRPGWLARCAMVATVACVAVVTLGWIVVSTEGALDRNAVGSDFAISVWQPGRELSEGRSPLRTYTGEAHDGGSVYPPIAAIATFPFSIPRYEVARALWLLALVASLFGGLWLCGLRDWRCYLAAGASPPVVAGILYGNLSLALVLAVALAWRFRDRAVAVGLLVGLVIAMKLFLWPIAIWLAITRRSAGFATAAATVGVASLAGWWVVGFSELDGYLETMGRHAAANDQAGASVAALAAQLGLAGNQLVALAAGLAALAVAWRRRRNDLGSFAWAVAAAVLASPMVWSHYYALLLVPLALAVPTWGYAWLAPFAMFPHAAEALTGVVLSVFVALTASRRGLEEDAAQRARRTLPGGVRGPAAAQPATLRVLETPQT
jgi:hypothetical protein